MKCNFKKCACYFPKSSGARNCYLYHSDAGVLKCHVRTSNEHMPIVMYVPTQIIKVDRKQPQIRKPAGRKRKK